MGATPEQGPDNGLIPTTTTVKDDRWKRWDHLQGLLGPHYSGCRVGNFLLTSNPTWRMDQEIAVGQVESYILDLAARVAKGQSVIFLGAAGSGKDHLMVGMMRHAIWKGHYLVWRNGVDMFREFRDAIGTATSEYKHILTYSKTDILAISDPLPPLGPLTAYQSTVLSQIIDSRYREHRPTWITINAASTEEMEDRMGVSIVDRLGDHAMRVKCFWPSYRNQNG